MSLKKGDKVYFMGIAGIAMGSLAGLFQKEGFSVRGSDQNIYPPMSTELERLKIPVFQGYKPENLDHKPDLVIVGNVISKHFEEAQALLKTDITYTSLPKAIAEFIIQDRHSIVVAGTHGKTTITAMASWVTQVCGLEPGFLIGGIPNNFSQSFQLPLKDHFIIEGDEYDTAFFDKTPKFIHYKPRSVILTSIEFDHADIYKNIDEVKEAFIKLVRLIPEDGLLIYNSDDKNVRDVVKEAQCKKVSYGISSGEYQAVDQEILSGRNQYAVQFKENRIADVALKMFGDHNTLNSLAVFALCHQLDLNKSQILQAISSFTGIKRRQEVIGQPNSITVIEDFAHHPTAVRLTLESLRKFYCKKSSSQKVKSPEVSEAPEVNDSIKNQKIFCVFEPRSSTSRRKVFQKSYVDSFKEADVVVVSQPYDQKDIKSEDQFSSEELVKDLKHEGIDAETFSDIDGIINLLTKRAQPHDVIVLMSNGGFGGIYKKLIDSLESPSCEDHHKNLKSLRS